jgi:hypothetical protein
MTTVPDNKPAVQFWAHSGVTELQRGVDYAAVIMRTPPTLPDDGEWDLSEFYRPVKVCWTGPMLVVADPDMPATRAAVVSDPERVVVIVGKWTDVRGDWFAHPTWTWQQYAAQQYGQVLRHNNLADRLTDFGIPRSHETYLPTNQTGSFVDRSLVLNFDELDALLKGAGF